MKLTSVYDIVNITKFWILFTAMPQIELKDVYVEYSSRSGGKVAALNGFSAQFLNGKINVIVGSSGCGKTTLLRAVGGLVDYKGSILVGNEQVREMSPRDKNFAYVSQEYVLYPHMTIFENIAFPLKMLGAGREEIIGRVNEIAEKFDITACLSRKPRHISGGQQQRVALARALVKRPSVILMDEPLSNLDAGARMTARLFIKKNLTGINCTTLYVTHDITEAMALADKLFVMEGGRLQTSGTPTEVYNSQDTVVKELFSNDTSL